MPDALTVYYDYTCRYSYRAMHWLDLAPDVDIRWATFSLKEVNSKPDEPSPLDPDAPPSISVLALALAHAARGADFDRYHHAVFEAMHGEERKVGEDELFAHASDAGVDVGAFEAIRGSWIGRVADEHNGAIRRWGVYGTPTVQLGSGATYLRLGEVPASPEEALDLLGALDRIASSPADLVEFFRPPKPTPKPIEIGAPHAT